MRMSEIQFRRCNVFWNTCLFLQLTLHQYNTLRGATVFESREYQYMTMPTVTFNRMYIQIYLFYRNIIYCVTNLICSQRWSNFLKQIMQSKEIFLQNFGQGEQIQKCCGEGVNMQGCSFAISLLLLLLLSEGTFLLFLFQSVFIFELWFVRWPFYFQISCKLIVSAISCFVVKQSFCEVVYTLIFFLFYGLIKFCQGYLIFVFSNKNTRIYKYFQNSYNTCTMNVFYLCQEQYIGAYFLYFLVFKLLHEKVK
eukprot:TRINITY_DN9813_c0_g1_i2.p1 TRINITY_DN9813_c0_g1~~TRINITY_DN9813_c0_g1_i2.p1  ORF type:complete len:252 (-),score=-15.62 TRINITY_DN9813_c0_g1_i2:173-928(-)